MIVGIVGKAGSGKDTVACVLRDYAPVSIVSLADPMKRFCRDVYGFSEAQLWGPSELRNIVDPRLGISPREALQSLGTTWGRALYENTWIDLALRVARSIANGRCYERAYGLISLNLTRGAPPERHTVIPDVRFRNEVDAIRNTGGRVLQVVRPRAGLIGAAGAHISETEQDSFALEDFAAVIQNTGTLEALEAQVGDLLPRLLAP